MGASQPSEILGTCQSVTPCLSKAGSSTGGNPNQLAIAEAPWSQQLAVVTQQQLDDRAQEKIYGYADLAKAYRVFREGLYANSSVSVRIGPVVGKVTSSTVVILMEVETLSDVIVNVGRIVDLPPHENQDPPTLASRRLEDMMFMQEGSISVCQTMEPKRPHHFVFEGLEPDTCYAVFLSNVCQDDLDRRVARFKTLPTEVGFMRILAVCGHCPPRTALGEKNPWQGLHDFACEVSDVHLVLHVGSTIHGAPFVAEAKRHLKDILQYRRGAQKDLERRAREALRRGYWVAWGRHDSMRKVLAEVGAHLQTFSPNVDIATLVHDVMVFEESEGSQELASGVDDWHHLVNAALEVSREYQRNLWHSSYADGKPSVRIDARDSLRRLRDKCPDDVVASALEQGPITDDDHPIEEWSIHRYGSICTIILDTQGAILSSALPGRNRSSSRSATKLCFLSKRQKQGILEALKDETIQVLVVCGDLPFLLEEKPVESRVDQASRDMALPLTWRLDSTSLLWLLDHLFKWKHTDFPARDVVLVSGGSDFATTGDVADHRLGLSIPVVITGPVMGRVSDARQWALSGRVCEGRFTYSYRKPSLAWNFCSIDVDLEATPNKPNIEVQLINMPVSEDAVWDDAPD